MLVDALAVLLILVSLFGAVAKSARKAAQKRPGQTDAPDARLAQEIRSARRRARAPQGDLPPELRSAFEKAQAAHRGAQDEGDSRVEEDGCIGGSLPHQEAHPPRAEQPPAAKPAMAAVPVQAAAPRARTPLGEVNAEEMRRAVVMAEVLARPVSLRPRGYRL